MANNPRALIATAISVAPVETSMGTFDTINSDWLTVQIYNASSSQILDCHLRLSARQDTTAQTLPTAISEFLGLTNIQPLESRCVDVQVGGVRLIEVVGTASGVGLTATIAVNNKAER